ncbi:MAG: ccmA [Acidimicrobiaceae bacterium]|nr:ccmA [Acidimicrobiaceae bacterium]
MNSAVSFCEAVSLSGRFPLLSGVTLDVGEGEVAHLRGPNGAGKTSLLRACAGLLPIVSGRAEVLGHDLLEDRQSLRREVGLLGHSSFLYEELSVEDNLRFALRASRSPLSRLEPALERLGLQGRVRRTPVGRCSTGQRRRAALAVLVGRAPRLWLLDEPHAGLDLEGRSVVDELVTEAKATGATVLIASHELERAESLADRVIELVGGRVATPMASELVVPGPAPAVPAPAAPGALREVGCDVA